MVVHLFIVFVVGKAR